MADQVKNSDVKKVPSYTELIKASGKPGEQLINRFMKWEERVDDLKIQDYRRMVDNDGQIQMLYNAIVNTILAANIEVVDDEDWEGEEDSEEKQFIEKALFSPGYKGGMSTSFMSVCKIMFRSFIEGYRLFEVVYKLGEEDKVVVDKLAPRAAIGDFGMKIKVDDNGNFTGFRQRLSYGSEWIDVTVENTTTVLKVLKVTYGEEFGSLYGRSGLKAVWYHYDKAHKGMFLNHVGHEFGVNKFINVQTKGVWKEDKVQHVIGELSRLSQQTIFVGSENEMTLEFVTLSDPGVMKVGKEMINLHYSLMAKSLLAQFVDLGSDVSNTGSRALGDAQMAFFKQGLQQIATVLIETPWNEVIASLIKINFGGKVYPKLEVGKIADDKSQLIYDALLELIKKGDVVDSVKSEIIKVGAQNIGLDVNEEDITKEMEEKALKAEEISKSMNQPNNFNNSNAPKPPFNNQQQKPPVKMTEDIRLDEVITEADGVTRPLYKEEQNVRYLDIKSKLDTAQANMTMILRSKLNRQKDEIVEQYIEAIRKGKKAIRGTKIELTENTYSDELYAAAQELMEYGKVQAANEMDKGVPTTTKSDRQDMDDSVGLVIDEQTARLTFRLATVANNALRANIPENEARLLLEKEYDSFFDIVLLPTIAALVPEAFNAGTRITYTKYEDDIWGYRYSAVLDNRTTRYCRRMDGRVFGVNDPQLQLVWPPNHFRCRSRMVGITKGMQESEGYIMNGIPSDIPISGSISSFKDINFSESKDDTFETILEEAFNGIK